MRIKADLTLFAVAVIWGSAFVAQGIAAQYKVAFLYNGASFLLGSLILVPFIRRAKNIPDAQWVWMLIGGGLLFLGAGLQQTGLYYTKIANAGFLTSLYTVFTPFLLWLLFREEPHQIDLMAATIACIGAFLLSTAGSFTVQPGDVLEVAGAIFWSLHFIILGKFASKFDLITFAAGQFFVCGVLNFLVGSFFESYGVFAKLPMISAILYRAIISVGIGYTLQVWGQRHTPPTDAALILGLESVIAVIAAWLVLSQTLLPLQILGCIIIFFAVILAQTKGYFSIKNRKEQRVC